MLEASHELMWEGMMPFSVRDGRWCWIAFVTHVSVGLMCEITILCLTLERTSHQEMRTS